MNAPFTYSSPTLSVEALKHSIAYKLMFTIGKDPVVANKHEWLNATLFAVRDRLVERWLRSNRAQLSQETRQVYYLSMEFLIGRTLSNAMLSLGIYEDVQGALEAMGLNLEELIDEENDPGLGNGGLGRLAACFLDSLATLGLPGRGYGIRYDYGMFKQNIVNGSQKESPDYWLEYGNPWEFKRHNTRYKVRFGGRIQQEGKKTRWIETEEILGVAYDQIIPGYDTDATNTLRLWSAQASSEINLGKFNQGDYFAAVEDKNHSENVSRVLYPDDSTYSGSQYKVGQWQKLSARFSTEYNFNKIVKAGVDFTPRYEQWDDTPNLKDGSPNLMSAIMAMDPTTPVMRPESEWTSNPYSNYERSHNNQEYNPVATVARLDSGGSEYGLLATPYVSLTPIKGLTIKSAFGLNARFRRTDSFNVNFFIDNLEQNQNNNATRKMENWVDWNWTNTVNYMTTINKKHNINLMGGYTMERFQDYWAQAYSENIPNNDESLRYPSSGTKNPAATGTDSFTSLVSYLGRVMYNYAEKYYLTASIRVDGSSKFSKDNKWATFPSVSGAYRLTGEEFMKNQKVFDDIKIRAGWGKVGNQNIDNSAYLSSIGTTTYVFGGTPNRIIGSTVSGIGNTNLKWETVEDWNVGLDLALLQSRLKITADYFEKTSHDMLMKKDNLLILGYPMWNGQMWENVGKMKASGWELGINWNDQIQDFTYGVGLNLSQVKNKAVKLNGDYIWTGGFSGDYIVRNAEGESLSQFWGYKTAGIFQNETEVKSYTNEHGESLQPNAKPGDLRFVDLNNDGVIDSNDKTHIGNPFPDLMVGLNLNAAYKGFDLVANFYGTFGNDIFNKNIGRYAGTDGQNVYAGTYDKTWRTDNTGAEFPRLSVNDSNMNYKRVSDFFVEDGSYFRCKLLQIGYTLPKQWFNNKLNLRLSFSAQNLFTITNYSGADPEAASMGKSVTEAGIDYTGYPNPRTFLFGLNMSF